MHLTRVISRVNIASRVLIPGLKPSYNSLIWSNIMCCIPLFCTSITFIKNFCGMTNCKTDYWMIFTFLRM